MKSLKAARIEKLNKKHKKFHNNKLVLEEIFSSLPDIAPEARLFLADLIETYKEECAEIIVQIKKELKK